MILLALATMFLFGVMVGIIFTVAAVVVERAQ